MERNYEQAYNVLKEKTQSVVKERENFRKNRNKWRLKCKMVRIENKILKKLNITTDKEYLNMLQEKVRNYDIRSYEMRKSFIRRLKYLIMGQ